MNTIQNAKTMQTTDLTDIIRLYLDKSLTKNISSYKNWDGDIFQQSG